MTPLKYHIFENIMENGAFALGANVPFFIIFENIMENGAFALGANAPFSIIFSKEFKTYLKFFLIFSMLSKNRN